MSGGGARARPASARARRERRENDGDPSVLAWHAPRSFGHVVMLSALAFSYDMNDADELTAREWRAIALGALARSGDSLIVCDYHLNIVHTSPRATQILRRLTEGAAHGLRPRLLPEPLLDLVKSQLSGGADVAGVRGQILTPGGGAIEVEASTWSGSRRGTVAIFLREESLRDDELYAALRERYGASMRGVQLAALIRKGLTNRQIAERLTLAESTVKIYVHQLFRACGVSSRTGLIALLDRLS